MKLVLFVIFFCSFKVEEFLEFVNQMYFEGELELNTSKGLREGMKERMRKIADEVPEQENLENKHVIDASFEKETNDSIDIVMDAVTDDNLDDDLDYDLNDDLDDDLDDEVSDYEMD